MHLREKVIQALRKVVDPHLGMDIVEMGLIYRVSVGDGKVKIDMTLTTPTCPLAASLVSQVEEKVKEIKGVREVEVHLVWDPPWSPEMIGKNLNSQ